MRIFQFAISILATALALLWAGRIYWYFFDLTSADQIGMLITCLMSMIIFLKFSEKIRIHVAWVAIMGAALPLLVYPGVSFLILRSDLSWIIVSLFLILSVGVSILLFAKKLIVLPIATMIAVQFIPYEFQETQLQFYDRVEQAFETRMGSIQIARWKNDYWLYYNGQLQFSTLDKHVFQEAFVQPAMQLVGPRPDILVVGGDNGLVEDELSGFDQLGKLIILPYDNEFHSLIRENQLIEIREHEKKEVAGGLPFQYVQSNAGKFDLIYLDLPDPLNLEYSQYYTVEFFELCRAALNTSGVLVAHSGDLFKKGDEVMRIRNSMERAGFDILPYQNQIPTVGHWTWIIGSKDKTGTRMREVLEQIRETETQWWDQDAMNLMMSFGRGEYFPKTKEVNTLHRISELER